MNRKLPLNFLFVFIILALNFIMPAQAQTICDSVFFKNFSINGNLEPYATKQLSNGEILVAGKSNLSPGSSYKATAIKFSESGTILWSFQTGGIVDDCFTGAIELSDNSYILYGITSSFGYAQGKILIVRVSNTGSILWSRQLGTASPGMEQVKSLLQFSDGDLVGTFNINDSTSQSDPVVFKIGLDGTLRWARRLDNGGAESLTSIAFETNKIYVSGFYTTGKRRGVLSQLNSADGALLASLNIYHNDNTYNQEVNQLEIINNRLSYGLKMRKDTAGTLLHRVILIQSDLNGANKTFETIIDNSDDTTHFIYKRTRQNGFVFLRNRYSPEIIKLNIYNQIEWSRIQSVNSFNGQKNFGMDITPSDGTVSAGYYKNFLTGNLNRMVLMKTNAMGNIGGCTQFGNTFFTDTVTQRQAPFIWNSSFLIVPDINQSLSLSSSGLAIQSANICDSVYCIDTTSLPVACNKTLLTEYTSNESLIIRDVVTTSDGGRVGVGTMQYNGWLVKFKNNGDIDWSKQVDEFSHNHDFLRVIRSSDNNILAFANDYYVVNHGAYRSVKVVKLDNNGTILFTKELIRNYSTEIADVAATPDGGFVVILNLAYGAGYLYSYVIRYDATLSVVWKKEIKHSVLTPIYRSIYCNQNGVWFGHDSYDNYNLETIGIQKLDYVTGNDVWKKRLRYNNSVMRFNRIMVSADTVYAFAYKADSQGDGATKVIMLKLKDDGSIINSLLLETDPLLMPTTYNYIDYARPTVTLTPQNDFVMSNQVVSNSVKALNISRFDKNGVARWSRNYTGMNRHTVFNIHPQGTGILILGTANKLNPYNAFNSGAFMLKVDSMGVIINGANGICAFENRTFLPLPYTPTETDPRIDSVVNLPEFQMDNKQMLLLPKATDATLYCHEQSSCTPVTLVQNGSACSLADTLIFSLANNNCGVRANWQYDTAYFNLVYMGDTLKLKPKITGTSIVKAEVEDDCSLRVLSKSVSVLIAASSVSLGTDTVICSGSGAIILRAGSGYQTYTWNDGSTDSTLLINAPGLYYVTVTDFCGGIDTDSILVSLAGAEFIITGSSEKCNADTVTLQATTGYINYIWSPALYITPIGNIARVNPPATMEYYIQAEKFSGCIVRDTFLITVKTSPSVQIGNDTTICYDKSTQLTASSGFISYIWNTGSTNNNITITNPGIYTIEALYANNCISKDTMLLQKYPFTYPSLGRDTSICSNTVYQLSPGNYTQYTWSSAATTSSIGISAVGTYWVRVVDQNGCSGIDTIIIRGINSSPGNFLKDSTSICFGETAVLSPSFSYPRYTWSTGSTGSSITISAVGIYSLVVTDLNGCVGKDTTIVSQKQNCVNAIYFPTAFTPNNNGNNDVFKPVIYGQVQLFSFEVYNRWGQRIFQTTSTGKGWDGKINGQPQDGNTFVWYCRYQRIGEPVQFEKGTFILIR